MLVKLVMHFVINNETQRDRYLIMNIKWFIVKYCIVSGKDNSDVFTEVFFVKKIIRTCYLL